MKSRFERCRYYNIADTEKLFYYSKSDAKWGMLNERH